MRLLGWPAAIAADKTLAAAAGHVLILRRIHLLKAMLRHKVDKFIFSSSAAVYGEPDKGLGLAAVVASLADRLQVPFRVAVHANDRVHGDMHRKVVPVHRRRDLRSRTGRERVERRRVSLTGSAVPTRS